MAKSFINDKGQEPVKNTWEVISIHEDSSSLNGQLGRNKGEFVTFSNDNSTTTSEKIGAITIFCTRTKTVDVVDWNQVKEVSTLQFEGMITQQEVDKIVEAGTAIKCCILPNYFSPELDLSKLKVKKLYLQHNQTITEGFVFPDTMTELRANADLTALHSLNHKMDYVNLTGAKIDGLNIDMNEGGSVLVNANNLGKINISGSFKSLELVKGTITDSALAQKLSEYDVKNIEFTGVDLGNLNFLSFNHATKSISMKNSFDFERDMRKIASRMVLPAGLEIPNGAQFYIFSSDVDMSRLRKFKADERTIFQMGYTITAELLWRKGLIPTPNDEFITQLWQAQLLADKINEGR